MDTVQGKEEYGSENPPSQSLDSANASSTPSSGEIKRLLFRFLIILVTAPLIGWLFGRAWGANDALYELVVAISVQFFDLSVEQSFELLLSIGFGLYAGFVLLFSFDIKKRVQGALLITGTLITLTVLTSMQVFIPNMELTSPLNWLGMGLGLLASFGLEADTVLKLDLSASTINRPQLRNGDVPEFTYAANALFGLVALTILLTLFQTLTTNTFVLVDIPASIVFLYMLWGFIQYEANSNYMLLGPSQSGKSMSMLGMCMTLYGNENIDPDPNDALEDAINQASMLKPGDDWPIPSNPLGEEGLSESSFQLIIGGFFPRRLRLTALDYAGQHLEEVADVLKTRSPSSDTSSVPQHIAGEVDRSNVLMFILDCERLLFPDQFTDDGQTEWGLKIYNTILDNTDDNNVILVATKADLLINEMNIDSPDDTSFPEFKAAVNDHLSSRPDVQTLLKKTNQTEIHPVYYETTTNDEGSYVPKLDRNNTLIHVGFDYLLEVIKRGAR